MTKTKVFALVLVIVSKLRQKKSVLSVKMCGEHQMCEPGARKECRLHGKCFKRKETLSMFECTTTMNIESKTALKDFKGFDVFSDQLHFL